MSPPSPPCRNKIYYFQLHESYLGSNATNQRILGVTVSEQGADTQQYLGDGQGWAPVVLGKKYICIADT